MLQSFSMNPYASQLGHRDPRQVIADTPAQLDALANALGPTGVQQALAPGKWSVREILCHLADTELVFAFRLRQSLAEAHHVIQPFDQDQWATTYGAFDAPMALGVFTAVRKWNLRFIENVPPHSLSKPLTHPERGEMTFQTLIETMAGHDVNHLQQIQTIAGRKNATASV